MIKGSVVAWTMASVLTLAGVSTPAQETEPQETGPRAFRPGLSQDEINYMANKHDDYLGALAPANLEKSRATAPIDVTGVWFIDLRGAFSDYLFGPPYPEFFAEGQRAQREAAAAFARGEEFRNPTAECKPTGFPKVTTYVWPTAMIQLPTVIWVTYGFDSTFRAIYLDGRAHTDPDIVVPTYNGEAIGHWEGDELVVHSKYFEPEEHYIDNGIPISDQFEVVERIRLKEAGAVLEVEYIMTDPKMWKDEWRSTKRFLRQDFSDIPQVQCRPSLNETLPSTRAGQLAIDERAR